MREKSVELKGFPKVCLSRQIEPIEEKGLLDPKQTKTV